MTIDSVAISASMASAEAVTPPRGRSLAEPAARRTAEEFEALFISQMLAPLFENLPDDGLFGGGPGAPIYRSLLVEEYGKVVARSGGIGLADAITREILRIQEA